MGEEICAPPLDLQQVGGIDAAFEELGTTCLVAVLPKANRHRRLTRWALVRLVCNVKPCPGWRHTRKTVLASDLRSLAPVGSAPLVQNTCSLGMRQLSLRLSLEDSNRLKSIHTITDQPPCHPGAVQGFGRLRESLHPPNPAVYRVYCTPHGTCVSTDLRRLVLTVIPTAALCTGGHAQEGDIAVAAGTTVDADSVVYP